MAVTMLIAPKTFFAIPLKKVDIESDRNTNRTYFIHQGRIVAVATYGEERQ